MTEQGGAPVRTRDAAVPGQKSLLARLAVVGVLLTVGGLIAAYALKASANHAAAVANSSKRLVSCGGSNPIALCFPKLDHPLVPADYTVLLIPLIVVVLGVVAILAAIIMVAARRRAV